MAEIAYQELTITVKDVATGMETTYTGRVKDLVVTMQTEMEPDDLDLRPPVGLPMREVKSISVHLSGEWVKDRSGMHYLMAIIDEPFVMPDEGVY